MFIRSLKNLYCSTLILWERISCYRWVDRLQGRDESFCCGKLRSLSRVLFSRARDLWWAASAGRMRRDPWRAVLFHFCRRPARLGPCWVVPGQFHQSSRRGALVWDTERHAAAKMRNGGSAQGTRRTWRSSAASQLQAIDFLSPFCVFYLLKAMGYQQVTKINSACDDIKEREMMKIQFTHL